jgi:hypothetical protein
LSLADLDACFDEGTFLRNVRTLIARLDMLAPTVTTAPAPAAPSNPTPSEVPDADR